MGFFSKIFDRFRRREKVDWDELEEMLISSDIGVKLGMKILDELKDMGRDVKAEDVVEVCRAHILKILPEQPQALAEGANRPKVILVVGVNGTGKTTSTAKLANWLKGQGQSVMLAAADTFRAAAIEQLDVWAQRLKLPIVKGAYKADPSAVCYDAYQSAVKNQVDYLICDTAGRLHTRHNLMQELGKMERVLGKFDPTAPHEVLLVVDATTGTNGLSQAKEFQAAMQKLSGLIVTKLDGSGKGGIVVAIQDQLGVPARFIGTGEEVSAFQTFDPREFVERLLVMPH